MQEPLVQPNTIGFKIIYTPFAKLYHYESKSRGREDSLEKLKRFHGEIDFFQNKWSTFLQKGDCYYNPNFSMASRNFDLKINS